MAASTEGFEIREKVSKAAAKAIHGACTKLRYECVFVGEIACFGYGGSRPPTVIEAIAIPRNQSESKTSIAALKRLMSIQTTDVDGRFNITPLNVNPTVLSFEHNQYADHQWKSMVIKITLASDTDALDVQPLETIDGLQYARPEHILAHRLKLWIQAHSITPSERSQKMRIMHRNREIDPLLRRLAKMRKKITKWNEFDTQHITQYCMAYQPSAGKLWVQVGLDPKLVKPAESKPVASSSSTPTPHPPAAATPSVAPPPYQADAIIPTPSRTSSSSVASTLKLQPELVAPPPSHAPHTVQQQPATPPLPSNIHQTAPPPMNIRHTAPPPSNIHQTAPPSNTNQTAPSTSQTQAEIFFSTPRIKMIHLAAQRTTELLRAMFLPSAIFGSLACFMYGNHRSPNDVDILVLPPSDCDLKVEEVKMLIVVKDPEHFFVVPSKDPNADYNILYYRLAQTGAGETPLTSCKVDLVYPGTLELPRVPTSMIKWSEGLPLIPFSVLLLQKLQSWDHHGQAKEKRKAMKRKTDVEDLRGMFDLDMMEDLRNSSPWTDDTLFTWTFLQDSLSRAQEFCDAHPDALECWRHVGFML